MITWFEELTRLSTQRAALRWDIHVARTDGDYAREQELTAAYKDVSARWALALEKTTPATPRETRP